MGPPKSKRLEPKGSEKINTYSDNVQSWTEQKKTDFPGGATSVPVPTGGAVGRFWTGHITANVATSVHFLWGNRTNQPRLRCGEDDGSLRPRGIPRPPHKLTEKGVVVYKSRREYNCQCDDGVKRDHPFVTNRHFQLRYLEMAPTIRRAQDMVKIQDIFSPSA